MMRPKVINVAKEIIGSVNSTVPTAFLGFEPVATKAGVRIGPHPPPPDASMIPATKPRAAIFFLE